MTGIAPESLSQPLAVPRAVTGSPWLELTKPKLTGFLVFSTGIGAWFAGASGAVATPPAATVTGAMAGVGLCAGGAAAFNMLLERRFDALMLRTRNRPLPAGRLRPLPAGLFASLLVAAGLVLLALVTNALTSWLCAGTTAAYVLLYTPWKRLSTTNTFFGAVTGAMPPLMGWTAAGAPLTPEAFLLTLVLFFWQIPHFLAIAWLHRGDYARAGFKMLPVADPSGTKTAAQVLVFASGLVPASLLPAVRGPAGPFYGAGALALDLLLLSAAVPLLRNRSRFGARLLFFASLVYLPCLFSFLVLDRTLFG